MIDGMIITKKELRIVDVFRRDLFSSYTIHKLMEKLKTGSYSWTFNAVKKLQKQGIILFEKKGHSTLCRINLDSQLAITYLSLLDELEALSKNIPNIQEIKKVVPTDYFTLLVAGSYAEGKQTKKSDLDVVVIVDDQADVKKILNAVRNKGDLLIPAVHAYVFKRGEFLKMLLADEENYGKFVFKKRLIFFGAKNYYLIIKGAIRNGFRG